MMFLPALIALATAVHVPEPEPQPPAIDRFGLELSSGLIGVFVPVNLGLISPVFRERWQLGLRASWSMPAVNVAHVDDEGRELLSYLPWMVTANPFFQARSRALGRHAYVYGGGEIMLGTTFATKPGLIGTNITVGAAAFAGLELWPRDGFAWFMAGGVSGVFTFVYDDFAALDISQHGGSGFFVRTGLRFLLGRRRCDPEPALNPAG